MKIAYFSVVLYSFVLTVYSEPFDVDTCLANGPDPDDPVINPVTFEICGFVSGISFVMPDNHVSSSYTICTWIQTTNTDFTLFMLDQVITIKDVTNNLVAFYWVVEGDELIIREIPRYEARTILNEYLIIDDLRVRKMHDGNWHFICVKWRLWNGLLGVIMDGQDLFEGVRLPDTEYETEMYFEIINFGDGFSGRTAYLTYWNSFVSSTQFTDSAMWWEPWNIWTLDVLTFKSSQTHDVAEYYDVPVWPTPDPTPAPTVLPIEGIECTVDGITVTVAAENFPDSENSMLLGGDSNCNGIEVIEDGTLYYRYTTSDLESCGLTIVNTTADYIVYHTFLAKGAISVMDIYCNMERRSEINFNLTANPCLITATLEGFGTFDFLGSLYDDENFIDVHDVTQPVDMCSGTDIYFGVEVEYSGVDIELFVEYCYVTEDPNNAASTQYVLINDGCYNDDFDVYPSNDNYLFPLKKNFQFSAIEFVYMKGMTIFYINCEVVICYVEDTNSRCSEGCVTGRKKRGQYIPETTMITQGPYPLNGCPY